MYSKAEAEEAAVAETIVQYLLYGRQESGGIEPVFRIHSETVEIAHLFTYFLLFFFRCAFQ